MVCEKCGIDNLPNSKYCYSCGAKLEKGTKVGVIVAICLGIVLLVGIQVAAVSLIVGKFFFGNQTTEKDASTVNKNLGTHKLTEELDDDYDWLDE